MRLTACWTVKSVCIPVKMELVSELISCPFAFFELQLLTMFVVCIVHCILLVSMHFSNPAIGCHMPNKRVCLFLVKVVKMFVVIVLSS